MVLSHLRHVVETLTSLVTRSAAPELEPTHPFNIGSLILLMWCRILRFTVSMLHPAPVTLHLHLHLEPGRARGAFVRRVVAEVVYDLGIAMKLEFMPLCLFSHAQSQGAAVPALRWEWTDCLGLRY